MKRKYSAYVYTIRFYFLVFSHCKKLQDDDMVLMARDIAKQIEFELEYPGQIKVNVIRESRATDYAK